MAIGTGMAIGLGASALGGLAKAKMQSNAAKKASKAQEQATKDARQIYQQGLGQMSQLYAPYINSGAGAMGTLGRLTTPGPGARYASPGPPNAMPQPPMGDQAMPRGGGGYPPMGYGGGYGGPFSQMMGPPQGMPPQGPPPWQMPPPQGPQGRY